MPPAYSGSATVSSFLGETRAQIADGLKDALVTAGWTVLSGSAGNWRLVSGVTPAGHRVGVRCFDPGSGNCARVMLFKYPEMVDMPGSAAAWLLPSTGRVYRVLACAYQFACYLPGDPAQPRSFVFASVPKVPSFISVHACAFLHGNAISDTDTGFHSTFRYTDAGVGAAGTGWSVILGYSDYSYWSSLTRPGQPVCLHLVHAHVAGYGKGRRWADGSLLLYDPLAAFGLEADSEAFVVGQLWDAVMLSDPTAFATDDVIDYDGGRWRVLTVRRSNGVYGALAILDPGA